MQAVQDETFAGFTERPGDRTQDARLRVQFYIRPIQNKAESLRLGRPVFEDRECIRIFTPGDRDNIIDRPIWDDANIPRSDTVRFKAQYEAWKAGKNQDDVVGTPLSQWTAVTPAQVETLSYFKIRSVEQLAGVSDGNLQKLGPGFLELRQAARDYLAMAADNAHVTKMRAELTERDNRLEVLERQMKELAEENKKLRRPTKADKAAE